jgi:hypothetical protein
VFAWQSLYPFLGYMRRELRVFALAQNVRLDTICREYNHGWFAIFQLPSLQPVLDFKGCG